MKAIIGFLNLAIRVNLIYPNCVIQTHVLESLKPADADISDINLHETLDFLQTIEDKPLEVDLEFFDNGVWQKVRPILTFADHTC